MPSANANATAYSSYSHSPLILSFIELSFEFLDPILYGLKWLLIDCFLLSAFYNVTYSLFILYHDETIDFDEHLNSMVGSSIAFSNEKM